MSLAYRVHQLEDTIATVRIDPEIYKQAQIVQTVMTVTILILVIALHCRVR